MKRIPTLDGWRGLAILLVLVSHTGIAISQVIHVPHVASLGQQGVAVFFVLSGFLITSRLLAEHRAHGSISLKSFYIRRFFRLMPCAWTYLAFVSILALSAGASIAPVCLPACLLFFRNFVNPSGTYPATAHFWTLSMEEQFYLVWPSLLILAGAKRAKWIAITGAACIAALRFHDWTTLSRLPLNATFGTEYRADALLLGCTAALLLPEMRPYLRRCMGPPILAFLVYCGAVYGHLIPLHESVAIAVLLTITSEYPRTRLGRFLDWKPLTFVGKLSYSLYVWQQIFFLFVHTERSFFIALPIVPSVAFISYYLIEAPFIRYGKRLARAATVERRLQELERETVTGEV